MSSFKCSRKIRFFHLRYSIKGVISGLVFVVASGCVTLSRQGVADKIGISAGFKKEIVTTDYFTLTAYTKITQKNAPLNIYIEGDGFAFISRSRISPDPTPTNPISLRLAAADPLIVVVVALILPTCVTEPPETLNSLIRLA